MFIYVLPFLGFTRGVSTLRIRLHIFQAVWRCCSFLHGAAMPRRRA
jgi:hypothetical protein